MVNEYVLKELFTYHPFLEEEMVDGYWRPGYELIIKLRSGDFMSWRFGCLRSLPRDPSLMSTDEITREFGLRLKYMMEAKLVSQEELSRRTGIAQSNISNYVNGRNCPSYAIVDKLARALNCSMDDFRL